MGEAMSSVDISDFLRRRAAELNLRPSEIAQRAGISRQTWYRLLNADVAEAKISTLMAICRVMEIDILDLLGMYFGHGNGRKKPASNEEEDEDLMMH